MKRRSSILILTVLSALAVGRLDAQSWRTVTASRQLNGEGALDVSVRYGAGRFTVRPAPTGLLSRSQLRYDEDVFVPHSEFDGRRLQLGLDGMRSARIAKQGGGEMELELTGAVPIDLDLEFGAVRADIDLGGLSLTRLSVRTGASESVLDVSLPNPSAMDRAELQVGAADFTARHLGNLNASRIEVSAGVGALMIDLTGDWRQDADVSVHVGLGSLELRLPQGVGVKLERKTLFTSVDTDGLVKRGDAYYSTDWDQAERRLTIEIEAAFGNVDIVWAR